MYSQPHHHHSQQQQIQPLQPYQVTMDTAPSYNPPSYLPPPPPNISTYNQQHARHSQPSRPPPPPPPPHHHQPQQQQVYTSSTTNMIVTQPPILPPPEPTPSATDAAPTPPLSITQLADFASTMVYLMWHARRPSVMALHDNSKFIQNANNITEDRHLGHSRETANIANRTSTAFKKFCKQILTATQLSESVILLSLKYIAMLLQNNPSIQGADGSEYRLFTVALMLANKFLDDNTFTNKTWSEVSGMKVTDLNIMELEFLDVLRFRLFIRKDEYERWKSALLLLRSQLLNADEAQKAEHQQQLLEETFKGIVLPQTNNMQQTAASAAQTQQQYQFLLMLSKAQLPHYPTQPLNRPLTRVPLRIPLQPVWSRHQSQQQQAQQAVNSYDMQQQQQQQQQQRQSFVTVAPPTAVSSNNNTPDYYSTTKPTAYDAYNNNEPSMYQPTTTTAYNSTNSTTSSEYVTPTRQHNNIVYSQPQPQQQPMIVPSSSTTPSSSSLVGSRLSGINLTSQVQQQDFNSYNSQAAASAVVPTQPNYYKLTSTNSQQMAAPDGGVYYSGGGNRNPYSTPQQQQPQLRTRNSFYGEVPQQQQGDYSSYDMSGGSHQQNDLYSRVPTAGYPQTQQAQQHHQQAYNRPPPPHSNQMQQMHQQQQQQQQQQHMHQQQQHMYNNNNNGARRYNGPVPEDPLTAAESYKSHIN